MRKVAEKLKAKQNGVDLEFPIDNKNQTMNPLSKKSNILTLIDKQFKIKQNILHKKQTKTGN